MKKLIILGSLFILTSAVLSSCKSHERCPAYGQVPAVENTDTQKA